jgi:hypothetical protein
MILTIQLRTMAMLNKHQKKAKEKNINEKEKI